MKLCRKTIIILMVILFNSQTSYGKAIETALTIDPFDDYTIRQRVAHVGAMPVSGTVGKQISAIETQVVEAESGKAVIGWYKIEATIGDGKWRGIIKNIPEGGWYEIRLRSADNHDVTAESESRFGVGIIITFTGQSNLWLNVAARYRGKAPEAWEGSEMSSVLSNRPNRGEKLAWELNKGKGATFHKLLGSNLTERLKIPVGIINAAWGGTRIFDWNNETQKVKDDEDAVFERYQRMMAHAGGDAELLVWHQGWSDFGPIVKTPTHYEEQLDKLYGRLTSQITRKNVPIICGVEGRRIPHKKEELLEKLDAVKLIENKWSDWVRWSQMRWARNHDYVLRGPNTIDIRLHHNCHFDNNDRMVWASRMTQCILFALGKTQYTGGGIDFAPENCSIEENKITLKVNHEGGNLLTVPFLDKPIEGFVVSDDDFKSRLAIEWVEIAQPNTIRIVLKETPKKEVQVTYLAGPGPICDILTDPNSEIQEPSALTPPGNILYDNAKLPRGNIRLGLGNMVNGTIGPMTVAQER
ncbi:sialate O-acetylesterase [Candidatus Hydrogenedentota bacterium]